MSFVSKVAAAAIALIAVAPISASAAPLIIGSLYQEQILKNCFALSSCELLFTAVPAAKTLVIREAACVLTMTNSASIASTSLSGRTAANALVQRTVYPIPTLISNSGGIRRYQIQSPVNLILQAAEKPRMFISATTAPAEFNVICTVFGTLG